MITIICNLTTEVWTIPPKEVDRAIELFGWAHFLIQGLSAKLEGVTDFVVMVSVQWTTKISIPSRFAADLPPLTNVDGT